MRAIHSCPSHLRSEDLSPKLKSYQPDWHNAPCFLIHGALWPELHHDWHLPWEPMAHGDCLTREMSTSLSILSSGTTFQQCMHPGRPHLHTKGQLWILQAAKECTRQGPPQLHARCLWREHHQAWPGGRTYPSCQRAGAQTINHSQQGSGRSLYIYKSSQVILICIDGPG